MAHHTYKTKAFVLGTHGVGEEHNYVTLLTEELGMVRALARSARSLRSRLRYHIQPLSFGRYALVRGREQWRLTGAQADTLLYEEFRNSPDIINFLGRYTLLLRRLVVGEEEHRELFSLVESMLGYLRESRASGELLENLEYVVVLRTLLLLGYVGEHRAFDETLQRSPITRELLEQISPLRRTMAAEINRALRESHL